MRNRFGFNLLTMSAIVLILGIIMSAVLGFYKTNNIKRRVFQTRERFSEIELAIQNYVLKNGKFPCPSALNCNEDGCKNTSDKFGSERRDSNDNCLYNSSNTDIFASTNSNSEVVLYGAVPFITLGIANNYSIDAWGNKIVYMIPLSLTQSGAFQTIILQKKNTSSTPTYLKNGIAYLLMSFARNKQGAYSYSNTNSNYFSGSENMPIDSFSVNEKNKNYLYHIKNFRDFEIIGLEEELQECEEFFVDYNFTEEPEIEQKCVSFSYTGGEQTFTVPSGVSELSFMVWGAQGGSTSKADGGYGGYSYGKLTVSEGDKLYVHVGGQGTSFNGYGASDIRYGGSTTDYRKIVAGGGGGAGNSTYGGGAGGGGSNCGIQGFSTFTCGGYGGCNGVANPKPWCNNCGNCSINVGTSTSGGASKTNGSYSSGHGGGGYGGGNSGSHEHGGGGGGGYIGGVIDGGGSAGVNAGNGKIQICYDKIKSSTYQDCVDFPYTGAMQTFTVPDGINELFLEVWGAQGGGGKYPSNNGGKGGYSYGKLAVEPNGKLYVVVGGEGEKSKVAKASGGYNGGGMSGKGSKYGNGGGGGATDIRYGGSTTDYRKIVAGGGGGAANSISGGTGGGGASYGGSPKNRYLKGSSSGLGANGENQATTVGANYGGGGGGGGGYIGGDSGSCSESISVPASNGGGGSGYIGGVVDGGGRNGINTGNGRARICFNDTASNNRLTFPKAKFMEVSFSKENCPKSVSYPVKSSNYYYMSNYKDSNGNVIDNRAAKRCGKNGKWESGYVYECVEMSKCSKPSAVSAYSSKNWNNFDFEVANTGVVYDETHEVEMKCIINKNDGAKWYDID